MKTISIQTRKFGSFEMMVDDIDYPHLVGQKLFMHKGYVRIGGVDPDNKKRLFFLHRVLLGVTDRNLIVDHKDRNPLNNQRNNIRIATKSQNNMNIGVHDRNVSGYRGVSFFKHHKVRKYGVQIKVNGIKIYGGCYSDPKDAALKYNELAAEYFGDFASLNTIKK